MASFPAIQQVHTPKVLLGITTGSGFSLFASDQLGLSVGYVSNAPLAGTLTLANQDYDELVLTLFVPEPSSVLLLGVASLGLLARRRSNSQSAD